MSIYYFAVDYSIKKQMWSPKPFSNKCIYHPLHPLPQMIAMKNCQGFNFEIINDVSSYEEHSFEDITENVYQELKNEFPEFEWDKYEQK